MGRPQQYLTVQQAADILQVSEKTIRRRINRGQQRAVWMGAMWRIRPQDLPVPPRIGRPSPAAPVSLREEIRQLRRAHDAQSGHSGEAA